MNERKGRWKGRSNQWGKIGWGNKIICWLFFALEWADRRKPNDDEYQQVGLNEKNEPVCRKGFCYFLFL